MLRFSSWLTVISLVFITFSTTSPLAQERLPSLIKRIQNSVVSVLAFRESGLLLRQGSGFFVGRSGHLVTNRHVLEGAARAEIKTSRGEFYPITRVVAENREADLVVVSVAIPLSAVSPIRMAPTLPEAGEQILVIGSPLGLEQTVSEGIVSAIREVPSIGKIIQTTAAVSRGSSGSPVVNLNGHVIGIATFQLVEGQNLNFAVAATEVLKLKLSHGKPLARWSAESLRNRQNEAVMKGEG